MYHILSRPINQKEDYNRKEKLLKNIYNHTKVAVHVLCFTNWSNIELRQSKKVTFNHLELGFSISSVGSFLLQGKC